MKRQNASDISLITFTFSVLKKVDFTRFFTCQSGSSPAAGIINDSDFHIIPVLKLILKRISISKVRFFQLSFYHIRISGEGARVFP